MLSVSINQLLMPRKKRIPPAPFKPHIAYDDDDDDNAYDIEPILPIPKHRRGLLKSKIYQRNRTIVLALVMGLSLTERVTAMKNPRQFAVFIGPRLRNFYLNETTLRKDYYPEVKAIVDSIKDEKRAWQLLRLIHPDTVNRSKPSPTWIIHRTPIKVGYWY